MRGLWVFAPKPQGNASLATQATIGYLSTTATFNMADSPYIDSCLNLSTTATFFCPQVGRCGEVQLYVKGA